MAKEKGNNLSVTRMARVEKKLGALSRDVLAKKQLPHDIQVYAVQVRDVSGIIMESDADSIVMRHKRGAGSSKVVVTTFPRSRVVEEIGEAGGAGMLSIYARTMVRELKGQLVSISGTMIICKDIQTGEVTRLNNAVAGVDIEMVVDETSASKKYGDLMGKASKPAKKSAKKATPTKAKKAK